MVGDRSPLGAARLVVQVFWAASGQVAQVVIGLVGLIVMVRMLGPEAYGVFALALMVVGFSEIIVGGHAAEFIVQREDLNQGHLNATFGVLTAAACVCGAIIYALSGWVANWFEIDALRPLLQIAAVLPVINAVLTPPIQLLIRRLQFEKLAWINTVASALAVAGGVWSASSGHGVWSLLWMEVIRRTVLASLTIMASKWPLGFRFSRQDAWDVARFGLRRMENSGLRFIAEIAVPRMVVGQFLGAEALGLFTVARRLLDQINAVLNGPIAAVAFPAASRLREARDKMTDLVLNSIKLTTWVFWPAIVGAIIVTPYIVPIALGDAWADASLVFSLLAVAALRAPVSGFNEAVFKATDQLRKITLLEALGAGLGILLCSLGAHYWGLVGVAAAIALRQWLLWPVGALLVAQAGGVSPIRQLRVLMAAGVPTFVMAGVLAVVGPYIADATHPIITTVAFAVAGVVVYLAAWSAMNPDLANAGRRRFRGLLGRKDEARSPASGA